MTRIAFDTQILVWLIRGVDQKTSAADKSKKQRVEWLRIEIEEARDPIEIVIPSIVVAEYLRPVPKNQHAAQLEILRRSYLIQPLNEHAASISADLFAKWQAKTNCGTEEKSRTKTDMHVVASAKAAGVEKFYSHDKRVRDLAELIDLPAFDLPSQPTTLF